ncbi:prepilin peptidase [Amycolatopsis roodepoortensis]|uniref:Leader peptidase (Prepilin peptidase)/N-methyltransferase n=1 Tax=Amycolatopsis roodepoortensis TaxID=700274 RepID=A0ABR9L5P7_9PSEU|nr:A24 family peptidase [Amycolatopsis roodepoortensis]MBE1575458.1 leader peptidase (prepilin peptidase)/N-methyltransferase [Amycolatopsis roodepoortensis]
MTIDLRLAVGFVLGAGLAAVSALLFRATIKTAPNRSHYVAIVVAAAVVGAAAAVWPPSLVAAGALLAMIGVPAAAVDVVEHRVPDRLTAPLAAGMVITLVTAALIADSAQSLTMAFVGAAVWGGVLLASFLLTGDPGPGDVKLAPSLGMMLGWLGWKWLLTGIVGSYLLAALVAGVGLLTKRWSLRDGRMPLAPPMLAATVLSATLAA